MYERRHKILKILENNSSMRITDLSKFLGVSEATVRRDLNKLHEAGQIQRIHGGAIIVDRPVSEAPVILRINQNTEAKRRIGKLAATFF